MINLDLLTYAGNPLNLTDLQGDPRHQLVCGDICDAELVATLLRKHRPRAVVHFAAESHVDRSISSPVRSLAPTFRAPSLCSNRRDSIGQSSMRPTGEISASFMCRPMRCMDRWGRTIRHFPRHSLRAQQPLCGVEGGVRSSGAGVSPHLGLPVLTTNCSNNYGPFQFPEKLIPLMILNALEGKPLPVYGDGSNVRDWLYVEDHCAAIRAVLDRGRVGETYNIGGNSERKNIDVVTAICDLVDELRPDAALGSA